MKTTLLMTLILWSCSAWADYPRFFSLGAGISSQNVFASKYADRSSTLGLVAGSLTWGISERWALRFLGDFSFDAQSVHVGAGMTYFMTPALVTTTGTAEGASVKYTPNWAYWVGFTFGAQRVQVALNQTNGSGSDIILAGLLGPTAYIGAMQNISSSFYVNYEAFYRYSVGGSTGATNVGMIISPTYLLP